MEYLQYLKVLLHAFKSFSSVLNLVINGIPSIQKYGNTF